MRAPQEAIFAKNGLLTHGNELEHQVTAFRFRFNKHCHTIALSTPTLKTIPQPTMLRKL